MRNVLSVGMSKGEKVVYRGALKQDGYHRGSLTSTIEKDLNESWLTQSHSNSVSLTWLIIMPKEEICHRHRLAQGVNCSTSTTTSHSANRLGQPCKSLPGKFRFT